MGDRAGKKTILVKEMWWEGNDLHVVDVEDQHTIFKNAHCQGYSQEHDDNVTVAEEIVYVARGSK